MKICWNPLQTILMSRMSMLAPLNQTMSQSHRRILLHCEADLGLPSPHHPALLRILQRPQVGEGYSDPNFKNL